MPRLRALMWMSGLFVLGCAGAAPKPPAVAKRAQARGGMQRAPDVDPCTVVPGREAAEYDTSGDGRADVRKVYVAINAGVDSRTVMICRQLDVNADGAKDVVRHYDDEGQSLRETSDRDFDGAVDRTLVFQQGRIVVEELDENRDGKVDTKIFFEGGKPSRAERDLGGHSTADQWRPDRWEYYENGHMVRMGTDVDGDARVDRWDRDAVDKRARVASAASGTSNADAR